MTNKRMGRWTSSDLNKVDERFDSKPGTTADTRRIAREIISFLSQLSALEKQILKWDLGGRSNIERDYLLKKAWHAVKDDQAFDWRGRLFAGLVSSEARLDGVQARLLLESAIALNLPPDEIASIFRL